MELVEQPHAVVGRAIFRDHRPPGDAVDRVQLDPALGQQRPARVDQAEPLDLLGVAARGREDQHWPAERAPPRDGYLGLDAVGVPP